MSLKDLIKKAADGDAEALSELEKLGERTSYLEGELEKAIKARDKAKGSAGLSAQERDELEALKAKAAEADEAKLKAEGDWRALEGKLTDKIAKAEAKASEAAQRYADQAVEMAFHGAPELFGGPQARTILTPDFALAGFRQHVQYTPGDGQRHGSVVVRDLKGDPILAADGTPAPFAEAMARLIDTWPTKQHILRNGGKAGSGSPGAGTSTDHGTLTRSALVAKAQSGDREAIATLKASPVPGQVQSGPGFARLQPSGK
ncbi:MAG TPA: hypothetical protein DCQ64_18465 [Candidatus Rokubacteria bacterium]|nr:hypothetical protein [Candidatus Rokubacteria bacterium]